MPLKAYEEFAQEPLAFPIGSKVYTVPPLSYSAGIQLQRALAGDDAFLAGAPPEEGWRLVLGSAWDEMAADDVPIGAMARAGFAALADHQYGRETAELVWEKGIDPKALQAAMEAHPVSPPSTATASGNGTRRRASMSSTKSPKKSRPPVSGS